MDIELIAAFIGQNISIKERETIISHLAECRACRQLVAKVVLGQTSVEMVKGMEDSRGADEKEDQTHKHRDGSADKSGMPV